MAYRHTRTGSSTSDIHLTDTVSYAQRLVCGNIFRSQKQFTRFLICMAVVFLLLYFFDPFGSPKAKHASEHFRPNVPRKPVVKDTVSTEETESEYRARYFEEIGRRMDTNSGLHVPVSENGKGNAARVAEHGNVAAKPLSQDEKSDAEGKESDERLKEELLTIARKVQLVAKNISKCREVPGMSIVLVKGDHTFAFPLGLADVNSGRAVTTDTRFLLNSISKTFLGQLLLVLISENRYNVTLDTPVAKILGPDFQLASPALTAEVTLRDLMSHRSGLSSGNLAVRATYPAGWTKSDLVRQLQHLPASVPFRKSFLYSNMGGMLAAYVAEKLGGAPWEELIVNKLLKPLGMLSSGPLKSHEDLLGKDFAVPYVPVDGKLTQADTKIFDQGPLSAVALLTSTARDMAKWIQFNLRQGQLDNGRQLIPRNLWSAMWSQQTELSPMFLQAVDKSSNQWPVKDVSEGYGLFWFINKYRGFQNYWHGGGLYSHYCLTWTFPEKDFGLYVVINGYSGDSKPFSVIEGLAYYAADLLMGYQPWLNEESVCQFPDQFSAAKKPKSQNETGSENVDKEINSFGRQSKNKEANQNSGSEDLKFPVEEMDKNSNPNYLKGVDQNEREQHRDGLNDLKITTPALLAGNGNISDIAKMKLEAVANSYVKLTTESSARKFVNSYKPNMKTEQSFEKVGQSHLKTEQSELKVEQTDVKMEQSEVKSDSKEKMQVLSRRIREVGMPNQIPQFPMQKQQNIPETKTSFLELSNKNSNVDKSVSSFDFQNVQKAPKDLLSLSNKDMKTGDSVRSSDILSVQKLPEYVQGKFHEDRSTGSRDKSLDTQNMQQPSENLQGRFNQAGKILDTVRSLDTQNMQKPSENLPGPSNSFFQKPLDEPSKSSGTGKAGLPQDHKPKLPLRSYTGMYTHPLIGNLTISLNDVFMQLECKLNLLTGIFMPLGGDAFGVELTGSLRFLSKPSQHRPAKPVYKVEFSDGLKTLDFHSNWAMEVPLKFRKTS